MGRLPDRILFIVILTIIRKNDLSSSKCWVEYSASMGEC